MRLSMMSPTERLHWTQRVALVRHNLHAAGRSGDFTFFKTLQAYSFGESVDHVATLTSGLGDDADTLLSSLDNFNAGIAHVHQDAFKSIYDSVKMAAAVAQDDVKLDDGDRTRIYVDAIQQKQVANHAIDRMTSSAITLIHQQPVACQEAAANVWITGNTIIADAIQVCLNQIDRVAQQPIGDFIRLEDSWNNVTAAVGSAISALKGIFRLIASEVSTAGAQARARGRTGSGAYVGGMLRRISVAWSPSQLPTPPGSPTFRDSTFVPHSPRRSSNLRTSVSAACPTKVPPTGIQYTMLQTIPCTPSPDLEMEAGDPFDTNDTA